MAAADVVNAVNALLEMGGDESLDLATGSNSDALSEEPSSSLSLTSRDKNSEAHTALDEVHALPIRYVLFSIEVYVKYYICKSYKSMRISYFPEPGELQCSASQLVAIFQ